MLYVGLPHVWSAMTNISVLCQEFQRLYRTRELNIKGAADIHQIEKDCSSWSEVMFHWSVLLIQGPPAPISESVITRDKHTWNFLRHFQHPVKWHSFSWSWRAKHTQLITEEYLRTLKNQCSPVKVPNFPLPFQLILLEL